MKLEKKHWVMLAAGAVILFLVYWFFFRKKKSAESGYDSNVLIIGDSSYDPAFPEIGGAESNFRMATGTIGDTGCKCLEWTLGTNGLFCSKWNKQDCLPPTQRMSMPRRRFGRNEESNWKMAQGDKCNCAPTPVKDSAGNIKYYDCPCKGFDAKDNTVIYPA